MTIKMLSRTSWLTAALFMLLLALSASALAGTAFGPPVKVTPDQAYGYEPAVVIDQYGNVFVTAHKENWQLVLGPDSNSPTQTRSMSWDWVSVNGGLSFKDLPGLTPLSLEQHEFGDEGDMALDDAGHLYFVDTNVADDTITRWSVTGLDQISLDLTRPLIPSAQFVDDRPWITAHGNGHVFYIGNEGDKVTYPLGQGTGSGFGPGRYTVYASYDGAQSFSTLGYTLKDSGWCRPGADHTPGSPYVYVICGNDGGSDDVFSPTNPKGTLYAYVSSDDGKTFERYVMDSYHALDPTFSWPTVSVAPDGSVWALYTDAAIISQTTDPLTGAVTGTVYDTEANKMTLYHSTDHGKTWKKKDVTPQRGRYRYGWLAVSADGQYLGFGSYYRPADTTTPWRVYGAIWKPGQKPVMTSIDESHPVAPNSSEPPADLMASYFHPDNTLGVVWTLPVLRVPGVATLERDIYFARSLP